MTRIDEMAKDLRELHEQATPGAWQKGMTTHHTVSIDNGKEPYRIAEFHHARDAAFCDCAHAVVLEILADRDRLAAALKGMHRFWSKYPAFVPAPEFMEQVCEAIEAMNAAMAEGKED